MTSLPIIAPGTCTTCRGVLGLEDRLGRLRATNAHPTARTVSEVRWFLMTLAKVTPCPAHEAVTELAEELSLELITTLKAQKGAASWSSST